MKCSFDKFRLAVVPLLLTAIMPLSAVVGSVGIYADETDVTEFYISETGSDDAPGTADAPFATIEKARDTIRELAASDGLSDGGITVYIHGGRYPVSETIEFTEADSGTAACPITYKAYGDGEVHIDGGVTLSADKFTAADDAMLSRVIDPGAKANLMVYDMKADGIDYSEIVRKGSHGAILPDCRLYINGERQWLGRYPDNAKENGYVYFEDLDGCTYKDSAERIKNWSDQSISEAKMYGMFPLDWLASSATIAEYDRESERVTFNLTSQFVLDASLMGRYFYYNVPEEIDNPGEYYIDRDSGKLYIYMPDGYEEMNFSFAQCRDALVKADVDYYTFDGITFENSVDDIIDVTGDHITVRNCTVCCCGNTGIDAPYCNSFMLTDSEMYSIGRKAFSGDHFGNILNMISSGNIICNNSFRCFAELDRIYNNAIDINDGCGFLISHNEISDAPHQAIGFNGADVTIEYNYIHDVCYESSDAGAIYTFACGWADGGLLIHDNIFENIINNSDVPGSPIAIYMDAGSGCANVRSNLIVNTRGVGILVGGQDIELRDNLFINSSVQFHSGAYYLVSDDHTGWAGGLENECPVSVFPDGMNWESVLDQSRSPAFGSKVWSYRYPWTMLIKTTNVYDLQDHFVGYAYGDACMRQNVFFGRNENDIAKTAERLVNIRDNTRIATIEDIGFADFSKGDYRLTEKTKIYHDIPGFKYCDVENVGRIIN